MKVRIPEEMIQLIKHKPEITALLLASFFQFGLQQEKGMVLKDDDLWNFLIEQMVKLDMERSEQDEVLH